MYLLLGSSSCALKKINLSHSRHRCGVARAMVVVGASSAGAVVADYAGANKKLRRQPHVPVGSKIRAAALSDTKGRSR